MDTSQDQAQQLQQAQLHRIAPHLIQASEILQCNSLELRQTIERELMENPALESLEAGSDRCADCELPPSLCTNCPFAERRQTTAEIDAEAALEANRATDTVAEIERDERERENEYEPDTDPDYDLGPLLALSELSDPHTKEEAMEDAFDPLSLAPSLPNLRDHLLSRLRSLTDGPRSYRVCEYLVNCLDERGWLKIERTEAMVELSVTEDVLDSAIAALQSCDPPGVGARDLRECLMLQLQQLEEEGVGNALAMSIVGTHWELLAQRRYDLIARRTSSTPAQVAAALHFIQHELSPAPASKYREPWNYKPDSSTEAVKPDVIIRRTATGFEIDIIGLELPTLHINARYRKMYEAIRDERKLQQQQIVAGGGSMPAQQHYHSRYGAVGEGTVLVAKMSVQERRHIAQYVERANLFLKNIQQRKKTIERITRCLIEAQQGFIETGSRSFLIPMTRTDLAQQAGLHESTVSRALLRKFVQLPNQDVVSFEAFFAPAGSVKDMIASMITAEDINNPFSDEAIRVKLEAMGISVARRTIVKYRESLRIPASYLRRKH